MMKYFKILFATIFVVSLVSCLKDKNYDNRITGHDLSGSAKIIELGIANNGKHDQTLAANFEDKPLELIFLTVRLAAGEVASEDITVTIDTSSTRALIDEYDNVNQKTTTRFPESMFSFVAPGLKVVIPKGSNEGYLKVKTNAINFNPSATYGLGFKIVSVDKPGYIISQNFGSYLTLIGAKNKYDGDYKMTINTIGWGAYSISDGVERVWPSNYDIYMITSSGNAVDLYSGAHGTFIQPAFDAAGGATGFGAASPRFIFDNATNKLTNVINTTAPDARNRVFALNPNAPATTNYFDPATHNIYANYVLKQTGRPDQVIIATFTYLGPRP